MGPEGWRTMSGIIAPDGRPAGLLSQQPPKTRKAELGGIRVEIPVEPMATAYLDPNADPAALVRVFAQTFPQNAIIINALMRHVCWLSHRVDQLEELLEERTDDPVPAIAEPWPPLPPDPAKRNQD